MKNQMVKQAVILKRKKSFEGESGNVEWGSGNVEFGGGNAEVGTCK